LEYLSNIELYFSSTVSEKAEMIELINDEFHHAVKVMRNREGDKIYITDGKGNIFKGIISNISKDHLTANTTEHKNYKNKLSNITFCLPVLKNPDRFKFALEKCTELGITNFIIFNSIRSVVKAKSVDKWNRTLLSAMKQSLRSFLPEISIVNDIKDLLNINSEKLIFDQSGKDIFNRNILTEQNYLFIFGPEGGFSNEELSCFNNIFKLEENRLRSETAVIKCASLVS
jgi:16S rRNA (uracil1498-N3)-methyltransferase